MPCPYLVRLFVFAGACVVLPKRFWRSSLLESLGTANFAILASFFFFSLVPFEVEAGVVPPNLSNLCLFFSSFNSGMSTPNFLALSIFFCSLS